MGGLVGMSCDQQAGLSLRFVLDFLTIVLGECFLISQAWDRCLQIHFVYHSIHMRACVLCKIANTVVLD
jgi:hypothetical protein